MQPFPLIISPVGKRIRAILHRISVFSLPKQTVFITHLLKAGAALHRISSPLTGNAFWHTLLQQPQHIHYCGEQYMFKRERHLQIQSYQGCQLGTCQSGRTSRITCIIWVLAIVASLLLRKDWSSGTTSSLHQIKSSCNMNPGQIFTKQVQEPQVIKISESQPVYWTCGNLQCIRSEGTLAAAWLQLSEPLLLLPGLHSMPSCYLTAYGL